MRLRPMPEVGQCFAYDPAGPRLFLLNATTWLVLSLCDGRDRDGIAQGFHREVEPLLDPAQAAAQVGAALADLLGKKLITEGGDP